MKGRCLALIKVQGLKKWFSSNQVLKGVDLSVPDGGVLAVIGASGSGKSTLLRCIDFLETPSEGRITLDEVSFDVKKARKQEVQYMRRHTAMVFQLFNLFKYKTALENVTEGLLVVKKMERAQAVQLAEYQLEQVGLSDRMTYYPNQLSGGQQQRVAIARALAMDPKVMLLDEPTSALDPEMIADVLSVIQGVAKSGRTMILVSHEMHFVYDISDRVLFLDDGLVLEEGTPQEVFGAPKHERTQQFISRVNLNNNYVI
jgi:ABC-type polar amino acid transport system ATPase subunit